MKKLLFLALLSSFPAAAQTFSYGAYGLFPLGSIRVIGMGGAFAALSDDASGMLFNPAGMSHAKWRYDVGASSSRVDNQEFSELLGSTVTVQKFSTEFYSAAVRIGKSTVFGLGFFSPFESTSEGGSTTFVKSEEISLQSMVLSLSTKIAGLSFGVTGHYETAKLAIRDDANSIPLTEVENTLIYPVYGISYRGKKMGLGASYSQGRTHSIDQTANTTYSTFFFRDVAIPRQAHYWSFLPTQKEPALGR